MARTACPQCGSFNEEAAVFCDQCGSSLRDGGHSRGGRGAMWLAVGVLAVAAVVAAVLLRGGGDTARRTPAESAPGVETRQATTDASAPKKGDIRTAGQDAPIEVAVSEEAPAVATEKAAPSKWAIVVGRDENNRALFSFPAIVVGGDAFLCSLEALALLDKLQVSWGGRTFTVTEIVGWDIERGYCLLALPEEAHGFAPGSAAVGEEVLLASNDKTTVRGQVESSEAYGVERMPVQVVKTEQEAGFALADDEVVGVAWYTRGLAGVQVFGSVAGYKLAPEIAISAWREQFWKGSAYESFCAGRTALKAGDWAVAAEAFGEAITQREEFRSVLTGPLMSGALVDLYLKWAADRSARGDFEDACVILGEGLRLLPGSKEMLLVLAREEAALGRLEAALEHTRGALALDAELREKRWQLLEERYLQLAGALKTEEAIRILGEGAQELPESANVRIELGAILFKERRYAEAIAAWEEAQALRFEQEVAALIEEARRRIAADQNAVVMPLGDGPGTIRTTVRCNGRLDVPCILDTGATYTAIPTWAVGQLGISLQNAARVRIATASGVTEVPMVTLDFVSLGPLRVGPIDVLVLDLPHNPEDAALGLLGLNFLKHFNVLLDRERKELRITPK